MLDHLRRLAFDIDATDPDALATLQARLRDARASVVDSHGHVGDTISEAIDLLERIIVREIEDIEAALAHVSETIARASQSIEDAPSCVTTFGEHLAQFIGESQEHILDAEASLLRLEDTPDDMELIDSVFRAFHTLKGCAGFLDLDRVVAFAHDVETLLVSVRSGSSTLTSPSIGLLLECCDVMSLMLDAFSNRNDAPDEELVARLSSQLAHASSGGEVASEPGTSAVDTKPLGEILCDLGIATREQIESVLERQLEDDLLDANSGGERIGQLLGLSQEELVRSLREQRRQRRAASRPATRSLRTTSRRARAGRSVRVSTMRVDALVEHADGLARSFQRFARLGSVRTLDEDARQLLSGIVTDVEDLQSLARSMRMVSISVVFQRMERHVRDLASMTSKRIRVCLEGEHTEIERSIVEEITDPLMHMVRNACDHAIESPQERIGAGKDEIATIHLRAIARGEHVTIEIQDDGRGLDRTRILRRAIERGLVPLDGDGASLTDDQVHELIFHPGFSTAESVTSISGRGVGMDVVRQNIRAIGGTLSIRTKAGRGTTFSMRLPTRALNSSDQHSV